MLASTVVLRQFSTVCISVFELLKNAVKSVCTRNLKYLQSLAVSWWLLSLNRHKYRDPQFYLLLCIFMDAKNVKMQNVF